MTDDRDDSSIQETEDRIRERYPGLELIPSENRTIGAGPKDRTLYTKDETSIEDFYVLSHYPTPDIDADTWKISLTGNVEETELTVGELREDYPTASVTHMMECAGNGRKYFESVDGEPERYIQWDYSGASTARWTGTPLSAVLEDHDAETDAEYWLTAIGGDAPEGEDIFARSLPMSKVIDDCLLAYKMYDEPLPPEHGFPVRLVVPGWYGVNSVKWVEELRVMNQMMAGEKWSQYTRWQQDSYRLAFGDEELAESENLAWFDTWDQLENGVANPYLYDQHVMSLVGFPDDGDVVSLDADRTLVVQGVAWAGDDSVTKVELSADAGETWRTAEFVTPEDESHRWRRFQCSLELSPGEHRLVSRATDEHGRSQPARTSPPRSGPKKSSDSYPWNREGYGNNAYLEYGVTFIVEQ
jgi:DMSO/TMAO reductase YedYZ molybdopterin-dependent catalytic subunit